MEVECVEATFDGFHERRSKNGINCSLYRITTMHAGIMIIVTNRKPYILETLTIDSSQGPDDWDEELGCWCEKYEMLSLAFFEQTCPWVTDMERLGSRFVFGATQRNAGRIRIRALVFVPAPELCHAHIDGENTVLRHAEGEIFCSPDEVFHVTQSEAHLVTGSFARGDLICLDGEEVGEDLCEYLRPRVMSAIEFRAKQLLADPHVFRPVSEAFRYRAALMLSGLKLSELNHEDVDHLAMVLVGAMVSCSPDLHVAAAGSPSMDIRMYTNDQEKEKQA